VTTCIDNELHQVALEVLSRRLWQLYAEQRDDG
jgi:hypothetical protein